MFSDHERETLREIQRQLTLDDPGFEESFRALEVPAPEPATQLHRVYTVVIVITVILSVVMGLAGSVGGVLAFAIIATSVWAARHFLTADSPRPGD